MERIQQAIQKAEASRKLGSDDVSKGPSAANGEVIEATNQIATSNWVIPSTLIDPDHLERQRIILSKTNSARIAFDVLRTRIFRTMQNYGWNSIAISSPVAGCGKTTVATNLAFSMARQVDCKTVLIDLDLRRPSIQKVLGVVPSCPLRHYIEGRRELKDCLMRIDDDDLVVGLNDYSVRNSAEMIQHERVTSIVSQLLSSLQPRIVIFDLPPMLTGDETLAFLPHVDCGLVVVESQRTTPKQIEECQTQFGDGTKFLGIVLNKCREVEDSFYEY